jgi:hypothetical protein
MVLLAVETIEGLAMVSETLSVLRSVYSAFRTHLAEEVLQTAQTLVQGLERRKTRQVKLLSDALRPDQPHSGNVAPMSANASTETGLGETVDQAEMLFENWLTGDTNLSWLSAVNPFVQSTDLNIGAFGIV